MADNYAPVIYTGNGSTTDRVFPFAYLSADHVHVYLNGVETGYELLAQNTVRILPAPANGVTITITRETPGDPPVTWQDGAVMLGRNLNASATHSRFIAEEARAATLGNLLGVDALIQNWDAIERRLVRLANPVNAQDAATKSYVDAVVGPMQSLRNETEGFRNATEVFKDQAQTFATNAAASVTAAASAYDAFDDRYLGQKAADPTVDNDGLPLTVGALYWSTVINKLKVWSGAGWGIAFNDVGTASALQNDSSVSGATVKDALNDLNTGKAAAVHTHPQSAVTNLVADLAGKEPVQTAVSQADAEAGALTVLRSWTPQRVKQSVVANSAPVLLGTNTISAAVLNVDFSGTFSIYSKLMLTWEDVSHDGVGGDNWLSLSVSDDNAATWEFIQGNIACSTSGDAVNRSDNIGPTVTVSKLMRANQNAATTDLNGILEIYFPGLTGKKQARSQFCWGMGSGNWAAGWGQHLTASINAINYIRLSWFTATGKFDAGTFRLYGVR